MERRSRTVLAALVLGLAALAPLAHAQDPATDGLLTPRTGNGLQEAYDRVTRAVMSPYCPGRTLAACPSGAAAELRTEVRDWLAEGRSEQWVLDELVTRYGEDVRGAPRLSGFGWVGWLAVPLFLAAGAVAVTVFLRSRARAAPPVPAADPSAARLSASQIRDLEARIERDLANDPSV